jgi:hypothetical protein
VDIVLANVGSGRRSVLQVSGPRQEIVGTELNPAADDKPLQHVCGTDEPRDERGGREVVDLVGDSCLLDPALVHDHDLIGKLEGLLLIVGDEQAGDAEFPMQVVEPHPQVLTNSCVQSSEGFVEEKHARTGSEGARQCHSLSLAS